MELWDSYHKDGTKADVDLIRGQPIPAGLYHMVCEVLVQHADGEFLLTRRALCKYAYPGRYEASCGGHAVKGETALMAITRELREETGIEDGVFREIDSFTEEDGCFFHIFLCRTNCDKQSLTLQEEETMDYCWVDEQKMKAFVNSEHIIKSRKNRFLSYYRQMGWID